MNKQQRELLTCFLTEIFYLSPPEFRKLSLTQYHLGSVVAIASKEKSKDQFSFVWTKERIEKVRGYCYNVSTIIQTDIVISSINLLARFSSINIVES